MAVRTKEELLEAVKVHYGDDTSDDTLLFIEDISDTLNDYESKVTSSGDWENKYNELAVKYKERFFDDDGKVSKNNSDPTDPDPGDYVVPQTYDDLFETEREKEI